MTEPKANDDAVERGPRESAAGEPGRSSFGRWLTRPQTMIALSAAVLSICGLFVSIYEASLIRQHQRGSVWPHVAVTPSINEGSIRLFVQNARGRPGEFLDRSRGAQPTRGRLFDRCSEMPTSGILDLYSVRPNAG